MKLDVAYPSATDDFQPVTQRGVSSWLHVGGGRWLQLAPMTLIPLKVLSLMRCGLVSVLNKFPFCGCLVVAQLSRRPSTW